MAKAAKNVDPESGVSNLNGRLPSFLNYTRSISPSEGMLYGVSQSTGEKIPVEVISRGIRGAISNYSAVYKDNVAYGDNIAKTLNPNTANLQLIEQAFLPLETDLFLLEYSVVFQANSLAPSGCNDISFYRSLKALSEAYKELRGYRYLAERYLWNLVNGRSLFNNNFARQRRTVLDVEGESFEFDTESINPERYNASEMPAGFDKVASKVELALTGAIRPLFIQVKIFGLMAPGCEVYPSGEFLPASVKRGKDEGKVLSKKHVRYGERTDFPQASMHSQKIGNAIRTIDDWHGQMDDFKINAVEVYGYSQSRSTALRLDVDGRTGGNDFYKILKKLDSLTSSIKLASSIDAVTHDAHFAVAMLIRGGVFSGEKSDKSGKLKEQA